MERLAKEAALLLYTQQEKEYKQAKQRAANMLGIRALPSNMDVALELDKIADEMEGPIREERLKQMRRDALSIMVTLGEFHPRLVGSVWRGTSHKNSDIDIEVFSSDCSLVLERLKQGSQDVSKGEWQRVTKGSGTEKVFNISLMLPSRSEVEIIVRSPDKENQADKCEIYGDMIKGLNIHQLRRILLTDPAQRFIPS